MPQDRAEFILDSVINYTTQTNEYPHMHSVGEHKIKCADSSSLSREEVTAYTKLCYPVIHSITTSKSTFFYYILKSLTLRPLL